MYKIGLTGGIACGKSAVSTFLNNYTGIPIIDADVIAREVVKPGAEGLKLITSEFGNDILHADGHLNRSKLGNIIFNDQAKRFKLDSIMFPLIYNESRKIFSDLEAKKHSYIVYDAPLLIEAGSHKAMDFVIVVIAPPEVQVARIQKRNGLTEADARARVNSQWTNEMRVAEADYVIENTGSLDDLGEKTQKTWDDIRNKTGEYRRYC